jgi:magnesium transporter
VLKTYRDEVADWASTTPVPPGVIWFDLLDPTDDEKRRVERALDVRIPSEQDLSEIEVSSRLMLEKNLLYLSSPAVTLNEHGEADLTPIGFVIGPKVIVTIRFAPLPIFDNVIKRIQTDTGLENGMCVFTALLEAMVDRGADVMERLGAEVDRLSRSVFRGGLNRSKGPVRSTRQLRAALANIGVLADRLAKGRDVLLGAERIASFAGDVGQDWITKDSRLRLDAVSKDLASLSDYETRLSDKIQMTLDAVLGFISIEQNDLFKILTIVSVVGVPPTLLAGIWGMNFKNMPELSWDWGYPLAWLAIIASGLAPLVWFKIRGWLN